MTKTGLDLRVRARRQLATWIDALADRIDPAGPNANATSSTPDPVPPAEAPSPASPAAPSSPPPLPPLPHQPARASRPPGMSPSAPAAPAAPPASTPPPASSRPATPATLTSHTPPSAQAAAESPEERQARHWARTRAGLLRFVDEQGGSATLRQLHEYSERTFFVAHVQFSKMMEELTDEALLDYDQDTATASLTDAGRIEILDAQAG